MINMEKSRLETYFPPEERESWKKYIQEFHDKLLLDNELTDSKAILICIYMSCYKSKSAEVSYAEVKTRFLEFGRDFNNFKVNFHNLKKQDSVTEKEVGESKFLSLTTKGLKIVKELVGEIEGTKTFLIEAGKVYSGKKLLQEILANNIGTSMNICDPYIGSRTLDFLTIITKKCKVSILTQTIENKNNFERELKDFKKEFSQIDVEVRVYSKSALHDRYIITDDSVWSVGASLKDLGNKDTIISKLGDEVKDALSETFEKRWQESQSSIPP
jgi:hypothetical protein